MPKCHKVITYLPTYLPTTDDELPCCCCYCCCGRAMLLPFLLSELFLSEEEGKWEAISSTKRACTVIKTKSLWHDLCPFKFLPELKFAFIVVCIYQITETFLITFTIFITVIYCEQPILNRFKTFTAKSFSV